MQSPHIPQVKLAPQLEFRFSHDTSWLAARLLHLLWRYLDAFILAVYRFRGHLVLQLIAQGYGVHGNEAANIHNGSSSEARP